MPLKTLFLNPPSFENFDGGAGSRWPATREIESYWYPVWLAYPAGMLEGARLLDAPPHHVSAEETIKIAAGLRISGAVHQHAGISWRHSAGRRRSRRRIRRSRLHSWDRTSPCFRKNRCGMARRSISSAARNLITAVVEFAQGQAAGRDCGRFLS